MGKFEIVMPLASGGMARIYVGRTTGIGSFERHVVLKLILPERANDSIAVGMFLDEARLAASLNHQNVAQVFEVGEDQGIHYLAMEYVHGQDLRALLAKAGSEGKRVPLELALTVVAGAAAGLNHAHDRRGPDGVPLGIVHRDVSPSNIMIGYDGSVKLLDFGIAKATARSVETQSGIIKGKFAYMAPEQCRGRDVDRRSDVFSLGIILYEVSTQHRCFRADSDFDTMHRIVTGDVVRPSRLVPGYPPELEAIVMKALAVDAAQRYQSAGALLEALEEFSVALRMSLSQMALGRFMREMFGDIGEPWLQYRHNGPLLAEPPRESTISNTNGTNDAPRGNAPQAVASGELGHSGPIVAMPPPQPVGAPLPPRTASALELPARTAGAEEESQVDAWNAKSYPAVQPSFVSTATLPVDPVQRQQLSAAVAAPPTPVPLAPSAPPSSPGSPGAQASPVVARASTPPPFPQMPPPQGPIASRESGPIAVGSQPLPATTGAFQTPGSQSGAALPQPQLGFPSGPAQAQTPAQSDPSNPYPRYERSSDGTMAPMGLDDLKPSRRPLYIGIGVVAAAMVVAFFVFSGGGGGGKPSVPAVVPADAPSGNGGPGNGPGNSEVVNTVTPDASVVAAVTVDAHAAGPGSDKLAPIDPVDDQILVHIETPPVTGAEVDLDGKVLGKTPLDIKVKRSSGMGQLTVKMAGYTDASRKVDLSGDFSKVIALAKKDDVVPPPHHDPVPVLHHDPTPPPHHDPTPPPPHHDPKKPDCQKPGPNMDPFKPVCKS